MGAVFRGDSLGSQNAGGGASNSSGPNTAGGVGQLQLTNKQVNKFINPNKMPMSTNYVHRLSGGMPIDHSSSRMNELLLESHKMIYAPPSREKTKQTMRSPMLEKGKAIGAGQGSTNNAAGMPVEEYQMSGPGTASGNLYQGGARKKGALQTN